MVSSLMVLNLTCSMLLARRNHHKNLSFLKLSSPSINKGQSMMCLMLNRPEIFAGFLTTSTSPTSKMLLKKAKGHPSSRALASQQRKTPSCSVHSGQTQIMNES